HNRILAAVAHFAVHLPARLSLHTARRQPAWAVSPVFQSVHHHAAGWTLARRELDLCDLGRVARPLSDREPCIPRADARFHLTASVEALRTCGFGFYHLCRRRVRLDRF